MLLLILVGLVSISSSFAIGVYAGKRTKPNLINGTVPITNLISDFEEFARSLEGGALSIEASDAIKALKAHAEQKYLPAPKKNKPETFSPGYRNNKWSDGMCFEKEMEKATTDDERIVIVRRWLKRYKFTQPWQTWCIESLKTPENRNFMRNMFDEEQ